MNTHLLFVQEFDEDPLEPDAIIADFYKDKGLIETRKVIAKILYHYLTNPDERISPVDRGNAMYYIGAICELMDAVETKYQPK